MATFDFSRQSDLQESEAQPRALPSWDRRPDQSLEILTYLLLLGIIIAAALLWYQRQQQRQQKRRTALDIWKRFRDICQNHGLDKDEMALLEKTLRFLKSKSPHKSIILPREFESTVVPELTHQSDEKTCEGIRKKLFYSGHEEVFHEEARPGGTLDLEPNAKLRVHFQDIPGTYTCTVIHVTDKAFVITLPTVKGKHIRPKKGKWVEGYITRGRGLYSFRSAVEETFLGGVFACRLLHSNDLQQVHQREAVRASVQASIRFSHFAASQLGADQIDFESLEAQLNNQHDGTVKDISVGGSALLTLAQTRFAVGDFVQFDLQLLEDEPRHTVLGQVVHVTPQDTSEGVAHMLHIQFLGLDEEAEGSLARTVHALQEENA